MSFAVLTASGLRDPGRGESTGGGQAQGHPAGAGESLRPSSGVGSSGAPWCPGCGRLFRHHVPARQRPKLGRDTVHDISIRKSENSSRSAAHAQQTSPCLTGQGWVTSPCLMSRGGQDEWASGLVGAPETQSGQHLGKPGLFLSGREGAHRAGSPQSLLGEAARAPGAATASGFSDTTTWATGKWFTAKAS